MSQKFRLDKAGYINRDKKISFKFNGKKYFGYEGDTLASALLANGVHLVGRSLSTIDLEVLLELELTNLTHMFNYIAGQKQSPML